ncbi:hypothetical protein CR152_27695 [Massilia violaceinigra]|uniref:Uncharacterized protein n=1 Tax=Massilia violaceinigra TaxID=2045208 RepID=A0A2D2DSC0_9BURK|nr:FaeA/PapI family transcriptional regulator [Massilia violaceinigra]ATQ77864.1 hypothetical protein CR152_27695 [Massilia violaceinigra]
MQARAEIIAKAATKKKIATFVSVATLPPTTLKVAAEFGLTKVTAGVYLRQLEGAGEIHRKELQLRGARRSGKLPVTWVPGQSDDYIAAEDRLDPIITMRQACVRSYKLNHVRDPLVAALFGQAVHS